MLLPCLLLIATLLPPATPWSAANWKPSDPSAREYADRAERTLGFTSQHLAVPNGGSNCQAARWLSYRREVGSPLSDAWYVGSQLLADSALARLGQDGSDCRQVKTVAFLDQVARKEPSGGYYPRANVDGSQVTTRDVYADDNALLGLVFLEARAASDDQRFRADLLDRAISAATFLAQGGLWDDTFGGGYWWNTARGAIGEGKPTQTTALAALLYGQLYEATGDPKYAKLASQGLDWVEQRLYAPEAGLYSYGFRHDSVEKQTGEHHMTSFFSYDQGIMIELHLLFERSIEPGQGHLDSAQALALRTQEEFWVPERGGYRIKTGEDEIVTAYSAWMTQSLLALHAADRNPLWLEFAQANLDALDEHALDPSDGGYYHKQHRCQSDDEPDCDAEAGWGLDRTKLLYSQAWMQRAQALLAARLSGLE